MVGAREASPKKPLETAADQVKRERPSSLKNIPPVIRAFVLVANLGQYLPVLSR